MFKPDFDWPINQESILVADSHTHLGIELTENKVPFLERQMSVGKVETLILLLLTSEMTIQVL